jgi:hypothetical protein
VLRAIRRGDQGLAGALAGLLFVQAGCASLIQDTRVAPPAQARHCEGSESVTSTHTAVLPIPLVAFFVPRVTAGAPDSSKLLDKCGGKRLVNRKVTRNYAVCAPVIFLSTIISLGIIGVCPTTVHYEADVVE